jgi:hypothetical protein
MDSQRDFDLNVVEKVDYVLALKGTRVPCTRMSGSSSPGRMPPA